ncbi:basic leucine zipper 61-like isoform X2 [Aristolochia californica]
MSRQSRLPPRCPFISKSSSSHRNSDSTLSQSRRTGDFHDHHRRSPSQSSILEEQPSWLDELLSDSESNTKGVFHRRSASDSVALLEGLATFPPFASFVKEDSSVGDEGISIEMSKGMEETSNCSGLEDRCVYGPNSPRRKINLTSSESSIVSVLSELVPQRTIGYLPGEVSYGYQICQSDAKEDSLPGACDHDNEMKTVKRYSGQRSRVRKLQYIAELERTVNVLEALESDLTVKAASLFQQRIVLSVENNTLKKKIASLHQEKMIKDGQCRSLQNEIERLKTAYIKHLKNQQKSNCDTGPTVDASLQASWQMLNFAKLSL